MGARQSFLCFTRGALDPRRVAVLSVVALGLDRARTHGGGGGDVLVREASGRTN